MEQTPAPHPGALSRSDAMDRSAERSRGDRLAGDGTMRPPSLAAQRQALRHCVEIARRDLGPEIIAAAESGLATLSWLERRADLVRALAELDRTAPGLAALIEAFPGSRLAVRETAP